MQVCLTSNREITSADSVVGLNIDTLTNPEQVEFWKTKDKIFNKRNADFNGELLKN